MFRTISQTAIEYRHSALSSGAAGNIKSGDRLPWVRLGEDAAGADNFAPLNALDWQVHVYGKVSPAVAALCKARALALHVFGWSDAMSVAGLAQNAAYLIRPDGYVGCAEAGEIAGTLERYLDAWVFRLRTDE